MYSLSYASFIDVAEEYISGLREIDRRCQFETRTTAFTYRYEVIGVAEFFS